MTDTRRESQDLAEHFTRAGRRLTQKQADRRRFMQGLVASGAFATFGLATPMRAAIRCE